MQTSTDFNSSQNNRRRKDKSTSLRVSLNNALQELKTQEIANKEIIDDISFIIFDYLDTYELIKTQKQ